MDYTSVPDAEGWQSVGWAKHGLPTVAQRGQAKPAHPTHFKKCSPRVPRGSNAGFSLLELLLVLFIMGLMTTTAMLMTGGVEDQNKYDETKRRMELIKRAIVGDPTRTVNGGPEISGFVADIGRLPECVDELLEMVLCTGSTQPAHTPWAIDPLTGVGRGWRGPYIDVVPDSNGSRNFRDGYGCGWVFDSTASGVTIQSQGADCGPGGAGNDADIPTSGVWSLVTEDDYLTQNTIKINLFFQSASASAVTVNSITLELDDATSAIGSFDGGTSSVPAGEFKVVTFTFPQRLPIGVYSLNVEPSCTSCVSVTDESLIGLMPRHQIVPFKWIFTTDP